MYRLGLWCSHGSMTQSSWAAGSRGETACGVFYLFFPVDTLSCCLFFVCVCVCVCVILYICVCLTEDIVVWLSSAVRPLSFSPDRTRPHVCASVNELSVLFLFFCLLLQADAVPLFHDSPTKLESCVFLSVHSNKGRPPPCTAPWLRSWKGWAACTSTTASAACRPSRLRTRAAPPACGS